MHLQLNYQSGKPVYLQIVDQIKAATASGMLPEGEWLPSIRPLAEQLRVNRNTVAKAYADLEREGIIEAQQGKGFVVTRNHTPFKKDLCRKMLTEAIDGVIVQAHHYQFSHAELLLLLEKRLSEFAGKTKS